MQVNKLIITPIMQGYKGFVRNNPSRKIASMLIKERLLLNNSRKDSLPRAIRKTLKALPKWVNLDCIKK